MAEHLMAAAEIRQRLGLSRQRVYQLTQRPDWPRPYDELVVGKVWRREDIEAWIVKHRPALTRACLE
jgi:prophage regulatory protein